MGLLGGVFFKGFRRTDKCTVTQVTICVNVAQAFRCGACQEDVLRHELQLCPAGGGVGGVSDEASGDELFFLGACVVGNTAGEANDCGQQGGRKGEGAKNFQHISFLTAVRPWGFMGGHEACDLGGA